MLATLGQVAVTRFEFERAIDYLSQSARGSNARELPMLLAAGELLEKLGDLDGAAERYRTAAGLARDAAGRSEPLTRLATLLERRGDPQVIIRELGPYAGENVEVAARVGVAHAALGHVAEAETLLQPVLSEPTASAQALARAHYGLGEVIARSIAEYPDLSEPMLIEEYITIVDVAQESYLNAARQGTALYTPAALGRLALVLRRAAQKLRSARVPSDLAPGEAEAVRTAITERTEALTRSADEAIGACREQAFRMRAFHPAARACLAGRGPTSAMLAADPLQPRRTSAQANSNGIGALRDRVARNPEDVDGLLELGEYLLDHGDPHGARVVFAAAIERGGGARATNLLGVASFRAGDHATALSAFAEAAEEGLEAARLNLADALREEGLGQAAARAMERYRAGRPGGRRLR
jgi:tetratricopeptide (TPR) repeat protein